MKIIVSIFSVLFFGCSSKEDILTLAETHLKSELKDPASYESVSKIISDTITLTEFYLDRIENDSLKSEKQIRDNKIDSLKNLLDGYTKAEMMGMDSMRSQQLNLWVSATQEAREKLRQVTIDSVYYLTIKFKYRAKNGFGALDIDESEIRYFPSTKEFKTIPETK